MSVASYSALYFNVTPTAYTLGATTGSVSLTLGSHSTAVARPAAGGTPLTFGQDLTIKVEGSGVAVGSYGDNNVAIVNNGTITADVANSGATIKSGSSSSQNLTNNGAMSATAAGSSLDVTPTAGGIFINNGIVVASGGGSSILTDVSKLGGVMIDHNPNSIVYLGNGYQSTRFASIFTPADLS